MDLQLCDILLKKGTNPFSVAIRTLTSDGSDIDESYSHVGIYAGNGHVWDARFPVVGLNQLDYEQFDVYRIPLTSKQADGILLYCESRKGVPYAFSELMKQGVEELFHIPVHLDFTTSEECSSLVIKAFLSQSILITRKPFAFPNDIWWSPTGEQHKVA